MRLRKKTLALFLGSTALGLSISLESVAYVENDAPDASFFKTSPVYQSFSEKGMNKYSTKVIGRHCGRNLNVSDLRNPDLFEIQDSKNDVFSLESSGVTIKSPLEKIQETVSHPLVRVDEEGHKSVNPHFTHHRDALTEMNALSYAIAKRQAASDKLNQWIAALNNQSTEHAQFLSDLESHFLGCMDKLAVFEDMGYQDRCAYIHKKISKLETYIQDQVSAEQKLAEILYQAGWDLKAFEGKSGYKAALGNPGDKWVSDDRGFVAFHRASHTITVIYHGSRNGSDWEANFDTRQVHAHTTGLTLPDDIKVHRGFANIVESCKDEVARFITEFHAHIEDTKKATAQIYISGHSLGAALATLSTAELVYNLGPQLFGEDFNNAETNNFKGFYLSVPKSLGQSGSQRVSDLVGHDNMMRQNVHGDPVPVAALKTVETKLKSILEWIQGDRERGKTGIARLPLVGGALENALFSVLEKPQFKIFLEEKLEDALEAVSGYHSVGHLALDSTGGALKRLLLPSLKALGERTASNFVGMVKGYWGALMGKNVPSPGLASFFGNTFYDVGATFIAPLHYGTTLVGEGGAFDKDLPSKKTDLLLRRGQKHLDRKEYPQKSSLWETTKSTVSGWFGY